MDAEAEVAVELALGGLGSVDRPLPEQHVELLHAGSTEIGGNPAARAIAADDDPTVHEGHKVTIESNTYHTVVDIDDSVELLGGNLHGVSVGVRLTIDGSVVMDRTSLNNGVTSGGGEYGMFAVPYAKSEDSMTLELYNPGNGDWEMGWRIITR